MGYGMKMFHKYRKESLIGVLNYKPKTGDLIEIDGEFYEVDSLVDGKRICYATYASNQKIYEATGRYLA